MAKFLLPDPRFRSPTAVQGKSDMRDENVYSAAVLSHGGTGQLTVFANPKGQSIPALAGAGIAATAAHQLKYTDVTTNFTKAGEAGSAIGDISVRGLGITIEQATYNPGTGAPGAFGATPYEVGDIMSKTFFEFKVGGKRQIIGPTWMFPALGAVFGTVASTGSGTTPGIVNNGWPGMGRKLKIPILVARTDTIEGVVGVAGSASLAFSVTTGVGQSTLVWYEALSIVRGDVR